jgi:hypothetical protein
MRTETGSSCFTQGVDSVLEVVTENNTTIEGWYQTIPVLFSNSVEPMNIIIIKGKSSETYLAMPVYLI